MTETQIQLDSFLNDITTQTTALAALLGGFEEQEFKDATKDLSVTEAAKLQKSMAHALEMAESAKKDIQKRYDFLRYARLPEAMDADDVENVRIDGVGKVYLLTDLNVSVKAGKKDESKDWLTENGYADAIQETVNSSTLKAVIKDCMKKGIEVPAEIFNVAPFTRAQITK